MKKKLLIFLTLLGLSMVTTSCKSEAICQDQDKNEQISSEANEKNVEENSVQTEESFLIIDTVKDVIDKLNNDAYDVQEIETSYTQEYYKELMGETIPGEILVVKTNQDKDYETYQQFVPTSDTTYYVVHNKFFHDQQSYQDYVDIIRDDRMYSVPIVMDKSALYIQLLENVELQAIEGTPYERALNKANINIVRGQDWEIIGKTE